MSRKQSDHGAQNWFKQRDAARAAGGASPSGAEPQGAQQEQHDAVNSQESPDRNVANRDIGQYSGQGVPPNMEK